MKLIAKFFVSVVLYMAALHVGARDMCAPVKTTIYYGNGVGRGFETDDDAQDSVQMLQGLIQETVTEEEFEEYDFKISLNRSAGRINDILESARQTFGNEWPSILVAFLVRDRRVLSLLPPEVVQEFNDFLNSEAIRKMVTPPLGSADLSRHIHSYTSDIEEGKNIVLISHSQGNIFGNLAYAGLPSSMQKYFTMVPVASPEPTSRRSIFNGHVRFRDDLVILGVEVARRAVGLPAPLYANDQDDTGLDWTGHGFVDAYMEDSSSRAFIASATVESIHLLPKPPATSDQGAITATLSWGNNPDVDLHVFEPSGGHIYYKELSGSGQLDVDDTDGFGPEHYRLSCAMLHESPEAIGTYRIGVNYFYGDGPETARVTVKTPDQERTFSIFLPESLWTSGDQSPRPVADVVITKRPNSGRFEFGINQK